MVIKQKLVFEFEREIDDDMLELIDPTHVLDDWKDSTPFYRFEKYLETEGCDITDIILEGKE